jgi:hypothetical protein
MSAEQHFKCACRHCGGHIEFPAHASGRIVSCPHCGKATELAATPSQSQRRRKRLLLGFGVLPAVLAVAGAAALFLSKKNDAGGREIPTSTVHTNPVTASAVAPEQPAKRAEETLTNSFAISAFQLKKTTGSSLVYVTGTVRNEGNQQRYGVKINFVLFDTDENAAGKASDYRAVLEPHAVWNFKALAIGSKAASAHFDSIQETQ